MVSENDIMGKHYEGKEMNLRCTEVKHQIFIFEFGR
jgi:hypothetical protein